MEEEEEEELNYCLHSQRILLKKENKRKTLFGVFSHSSHKIHKAKKQGRKEMKEEEDREKNNRRGCNEGIIKV